MPNNLPGELTSFIGRRTELAEIGDSLGGRLLTLTGAGGCGKTRPSIVALVVNHHDHSCGCATNAQGGSDVEV